MSALWVQTTVVSMLAVWTIPAVLIVCATMDSAETVLLVLVSAFLNVIHIFVQPLLCYEASVVLAHFCWVQH